MRESFDLIVIGAGPAGAEAALYGARRGARTLLIDRRPPPRAKLCGGCISRRAHCYLDEPLPPRLVESAMTRVRLKYRDGEGDFAASPDFGTFVDRAEFDHWLVSRAQAAGAEFRVDCALGLDLSTRPYKITTAGGSYFAGGVVIATGSDGPLTRLVRRPDPLDRSALGLECKLDPGKACGVDLAPGEAEFDFSAVPSGFAWRLHHGSCIYLGIGGLRTDKNALLEGWRSLLRRFGPLDGKAKPAGHLIPCGGYRRSLGAGRVLLAGDAAGFADAFTGEGIAWALLSGRLAAEALMCEFRSGDAPVRHYAQMCRRRFGAELAWSLRLKRAARLSPRLLEAFCSDPRIFAAYLGVFTGDYGYRTFVGRTAKHLVRRLWSRGPASV